MNQITHHLTLTDPPIQNLIIKSASEKGVVISGYASVYNVADQAKDLIVKGAFASVNPQSIKFLWQHDTKKPIGKITSLSEDEYGLKMEAIINNNIEAGREAIELVRQGAVDGLSIGFNIELSNYNTLKQRIITKAKLHEISIVTFPAQQLAKISHITKYSPNNQEHNMDIEPITKQISAIDSRFTNFLKNEEKSYSKINELEGRMNNLQSFLSRPDVGIMQDIEYKAVFNDYIRKGNNGDLIQKSLNNGAEEGGVLVVPTLYSGIMNEINARSPMRQLASIETISTNALDIVMEEGKFATGWVGEMEAREETTASKLKQQRIFVHELYAQPKASQTLLDDVAINIEDWLKERLSNSFLKAENESFINGDGKKKPRGILSIEHTKIEKFNIGAKVTAEKLLDFVNMLDEEYLANATFLMNRRTLSEVQKLQDNNGCFIWQQFPSNAFKQTIFGIPVVCSSEIPVIEKDSLSIILGDFKASYKIVDRAGIKVMRDPFTDKPFVKFYAVKRVGGDVINQRALKIAKFS